MNKEIPRDDVLEAVVVDESTSYMPTGEELARATAMSLEENGVDLPPGVVLSGYSFADKYQGLGPIGSGGENTIYKAANRKTGEEVAVRHIAYFDDRFHRIMGNREALLKNDNENVAKHLDFIVAKDPVNGGYQVSVVTEYVNGKTLKERKESESFDYERCNNVLEQLLNGLNSVHAEGVKHRDIKPSNVMLTDEGVVKIIDFGIAKQDLEQTMTATRYGLIGTPAYMSPEQLDPDRSVTSASDLWQAGKVVTELASFVGGTVDDVMMREEFVQRLRYLTSRNVDERKKGLSEVVLEQVVPEVEDLEDRAALTKEKFPEVIDKYHFEDNEKWDLIIGKILGTIVGFVAGSVGVIVATVYGYDLSSLETVGSMAAAVFTGVGLGHYAAKRSNTIAEITDETELDRTRRKSEYTLAGAGLGTVAGMIGFWGYNAVQSSLENIALSEMGAAAAVGAVTCAVIGRGVASARDLYEKREAAKLEELIGSQDSIRVKKFEILN